jgi:hypothetical protein
MFANASAVIFGLETTASVPERDIGEGRLAR